MGYTIGQISNILLKADRTMYKIGQIAYEDMFAEDSEALDYERDIIFIYKKAVEYADDFFVGTAKLDATVEKLASKISVYDYGLLNPVYSDVASNLSNLVVGAASLDDLTDVTISNILNNQILRYNASLNQWVNVGPGSAVRNSQTFIATANQSIFTTAYPFDIGLFDVYLNGVRLNSSSYTTMGEYQITLVDAAESADIIDVVIYDVDTTIVNPINSLSDLDDVIIGPLSNKQALYFNSTSGKWENGAVFVPYTGAISNVNLGTFDLTADIITGNTIVKVGGTSSQFLKADGTVDSNTYTPTSRTITINGVTFDLSADRTYTIAAGVTGTGVAGQVAYFTGASTQAGSNNLFWDNTNGRLGVGTNTPQGNIQISENKNGITNLQISNTTAGTASQSGLRLDSDASSGTMNIGKYSSTSNSYLSISSRDGYLSNANFGDIVLQNEVVTGRIKFAAGASSTAHLTIAATGAATFSSSVTAASLVKSGGLSTEYLKADGSVSTLTNPITGTGVSGQVAYWSGASTQTGSNNLFWDNTNGRLGIGTNVPTGILDIIGVLTNGNTTTALTVSGGVTKIKGNYTTAVGNSIEVSNFSNQIGLSVNGVGLVFASSLKVGLATNISDTSSGYNFDIIKNSTGITFSNSAAATLPYFFTINSSERFRISNTFSSFPNGNLLIGSTSDSGQRLQVTGDTLLRGSGATSATFALIVQNSSGTEYFSVRNEGLVSSALGYYFGAGGVISASASNHRNIRFSAGLVNLLGAYGSGIANSIYLFSYANSNNTDANTNSLFGIVHTFNPTSGTSGYIMAGLQPTINQTGGANGITRGLYINPTLTAAADWRSIEWSNNSGFGLYGAGTADNYIAGKLGIGTTTPAQALSIIRNEDTSSGIETQNLSTGTAANSGIIVRNSATSGQLFKLGTGYGGYKTLQVSDLGFYNAGAGDISIFNEAPSGKIKFLSGNIASTAQMTLHATGNLAIGSTTDSTQRLQVTGDTLLRGSGNTSGTNALLVQNSAGTQLLRLYNIFTAGAGTGLEIGDGTAANTTIIDTQQGEATIKTRQIITNSSAGILRINGGVGIGNNNLASNFGSLTLGEGNFVLTNPTQFNVAVSVTGSFIPTSGGARFIDLLVTPTINQTGGANGITRGLYVNPTLTAAADWRSIETSNNIGFAFYGAGTANSFFNGNVGLGLTPTHRLSIGDVTLGTAAGAANEVQFGRSNANSIFRNGQSGTNNGYLAWIYNATAASAYLEVGTFGNANRVDIAGSQLRLNPTGNVIIGSTSDTSEKLQVNGTMKVTGASTFGGDVSLTLNQNASTRLTITNTTAGTSGEAALKLETNSSQALVSKYSSSTNAYKIITPSDFVFYNINGGSISILNDFASGNIKMAAGGSSTSHFTIASTGAATFSSSVQAGGGTTNASAILQADSTTKGFLPPRMTTVQINAIATPAEGLQVYNTTINHMCFYQAGAWAKISHSPM